MVAAAAAAAEQQQHEDPAEDASARRETETESDIPPHRQVIISPLIDCSPAELARSVMGDPHGRTIKLDDDGDGGNDRKADAVLSRPVVY